MGTWVGELLTQTAMGRARLSGIRRLRRFLSTSAVGKVCPLVTHSCHTGHTDQPLDLTNCKHFSNCICKEAHLSMYGSTSEC